MTALPPPLIATGCYSNIPKTYPGAISISVSAPRWYGRIPSIPELSPKGFKNDPIPSYVPKYEALLRGLDAQDVVNEAMQLAYDRAKAMGMSHDDASNITPVLLCWEKPGQFCHRRLFAGWAEQQLSLYVPEVKFVEGQLQAVPVRSNPAKPPAPAVEQQSLF